MEPKHAIFLVGLLLCVPLGAALATWSSRVRDGLFFALVFGTALVKKADINFVSREWYRGSTVGLEVSVLDFVALMLIAGALFARRDRARLFWPASLGPMLAYLAWCTVSVLAAEPRLFGAFELSKLVRGILLFLAVALYVRERRQHVLLLSALASVAVLEALTALKDHYLLGLYRIGATLGHPNSLSLYSCMITPVLVSASVAKLPRWLKLLTAAGALSALLCVILTVSRTGVVTVVLVGLGALLASVDFRLTAKKAAVGVLGLLVVGGMFFKAKDSLLGRFQERSLSMEYGDEGTEGRGVYLRLAKEIFRDHPLGIGLNNWSYAVSGTYGPRIGMFYVPYEGTDTRPDQEIPWGSALDNAQAAPAHNLLALTLGELGLPGVALLVALWLRWFWLGAVFLRPRSAELAPRLAVGLLFGVGAAFLQSGTEWIFRQTNIFFLFHAMVGALAALHHHRRPRRRPGASASAPVEPTSRWTPSPAGAVALAGGRGA